MKKIGVLGPKGTYSELTAYAQFKSGFELVRYHTITDVVKAVGRGSVDGGIMPIESLREGSVGEALDALTWGNIKIKGEIVSQVSHALLAIKGTKIENVTHVLSHPQALAQCRGFLRKKIPDAELIDMASTAKAAEQVSKTKKLHMAAIGPNNLVELYGLEILHDNIQSGEKNITRFLHIAKNDNRRTGTDKTSIVFYTKVDRPGILHEILGVFASRKINLTKIESRPSKRALGEYFFFIDFVGHRRDKEISDVLKEIKKKTAMLKIIGSYPKKF